MMIELARSRNSADGAQFDTPHEFGADGGKLAAELREFISVMNCGPQSLIEARPSESDVGRSVQAVVCVVKGDDAIKLRRSDFVAAPYTVGLVNFKGGNQVITYSIP